MDRLRRPCGRFVTSGTNHSSLDRALAKLNRNNGHGSNAKVIDPVLRRIRYDTGALVAFYKPYAERYMGLVKDLMEIDARYRSSP